MIDLKLKDEESGLIENIPPNVLKSLLTAATADSSSKGKAAATIPKGNSDTPENEFEILPEPGFVLKTKTSSQQKVFINICHSPYVPKAPLISDSELDILTSMKGVNEVTQEMEKMSAKFKVPMSVSSLKKDKDKCKLILINHNHQFR